MGIFRQRNMKIQTLAMQIFLLSLIGTVVNGLKCYNCNYTMDAVGQSNPGCEYASPLEEYLNEIDPRVQNQNSDTAFCNLITVKSNGRTVAIYRSGHSSNALKSSLNGKCIDLVANPQQDIQAYIQKQWKNKSVNTLDEKMCKDGTMRTENITIFGCFCDSMDGCNGANFDPSDENMSGSRTPVSILTVRTCYFHKKEESSQSTQNSNGIKLIAVGGNIYLQFLIGILSFTSSLWLCK